MLDILETGTNTEKAGAANALYWANVLRSDAASAADAQNQPDTAHAESDDALADIWLRQRSLVLQEFIANPHVDVRRSLISKMNLHADAYPDHLKPLINTVIDIARNHPDDYIRYRIEVQLGNERLFRPLPERD